MRAVLVWMLTVGLALTSCGDSSAEKTCIAGEKVGCTCADGNRGESFCPDDGSAYGACQCGDGSGNPSGTVCIAARQGVRLPGRRQRPRALPR